MIREEHRRNRGSSGGQSREDVIGFRRPCFVPRQNQQVMPGAGCQFADRDGLLLREDVVREEDPLWLALWLELDDEVRDAAAAVPPCSQVQGDGGDVAPDECKLVWSNWRSATSAEVHFVRRITGADFVESDDPDDVLVPTQQVGQDMTSSRLGESALLPVVVVEVRVFDALVAEDESRDQLI